LAGDQVAPQDNADGRQHLLGMRTQRFKLGTYARWRSGTALDTGSLETEFYDYRTAEGQAEVHNTPDAPRAGEALDYLLSSLLPNELEAPLPAVYTKPQAAALAAYLRQ
jgi:hypothetical protein